MKLPAHILAAVAMLVSIVGCGHRDPPSSALSTAPSSVSLAGIVPPGVGDPRNGPWNRNLEVLRSTDGLTFAGRTLMVERAGVPCVIRATDNRLVAVFQWFPFDDRSSFDRVAVAFSEDDGLSWTKPVAVNVAGLPAELMRPFDPVVVQIPDGRFRLYFTSNGRGADARPAIYSAISRDARNYDFEPGPRFSPPAGTVDASVVAFGGAWHLFSHNQQANTGRGYHALSRDGLAFDQQADVDVGVGHQWIGNALAVAGMLRYYGSGTAGVWSAISTDGATWKLEPGVRASAGDPAAVTLPDGTTLLVVVGDLRPDAGPAPP